MALKALLLVLAPLATALVPPCLPELGPQFCPGTAESAGLDGWGEHNIEKRLLSPTIYPALTQEALLKERIFPLLNKTDLEEGIRLFTLPRWKPNRYCKSKFGVIAKDWISEAVEHIMERELHFSNGSSMPMSFRWIENETPQKSIIFRIMTPTASYEPGNTIVLGAHMDSINANPARNQSADRMIAPGANDNASGTMVLLTVLKVLGRLFADKPVTNEVQFHWYGAEEIGLKGSESVFASLRNQSFTVKAMLNLDMVGYAGAHDPGSPKIALQKGYANQDLTDFVAKLVTTYTNAEPSFSSCGYPCSDHASAHRHGFPSAMMGESSYLAKEGIAPNGNPNIHSETDTIETLDFDYMLEFAKVAAAFVAELAYTNFTALESEGR